MGLGFTLLRLSPESFWAMAPREFFAALDALRAPTKGATPPGRATLDALMRRFPDLPPDDEARP